MEEDNIIVKTIREWIATDLLHTVCMILVIAITSFAVGGLVMVPLGVTHGQSPSAATTIPFSIGDAEHIMVNTDKLVAMEKRLDQHRDWIIDLQSSVAMIKGVGIAVGSIVVILSALGLIVKRKP